MSASQPSSQSTGQPFAAFPVARTDDDIVVQEVADEFVIYDLKRHKVHSLNPTAASVWRWCDGRTGIDELARRLGEELALPDDQALPLLELALRRLDQAQLLERPAGRTLALPTVDRRTLLRRLGAATLLPVVYTLVAPTAAHAASVPIGTCIPKTSGCGGTSGLGDCYTSDTCGGSLVASNISCSTCFGTPGRNSWKRTS